MKCSLILSKFLEKICSLFHSIVCLYFFALIPEDGFLVSPHYCLELFIEMGKSFLLSFAFQFPSFHRFVRLSQSVILLFCIFPLLGTVLIPVFLQCHEPPSIVHQMLCLSDLVP